MNRRTFLLEAAAGGTLTSLLAGCEQAKPKVPVAPAHKPVEGQVATEYIWSGGVTPVSARVNVKIADPLASVSANGKPVQAIPRTRLVLTEQGSTSPPIYSNEQVPTSEFGYNVTFEMAGLKPDTAYEYQAEVNGELVDALQGQFKTFPSGPASFRCCFASCAQTGSSSQVFETIVNQNPAFFIHMGDFHYENIDRVDSARRRRAYATVHGSPTQAKLFRSVPIAYMWDDHDYIGNDTGGMPPAGVNARFNYQHAVPHYPLALGNGNVPIAQAFTCGRVRFILTDLRSGREGATTLGEVQKAWFKNELLAAKKEHGLIVWMSTFPWIGKANPSITIDFWAGYADERREIANFLRDNGIKNICIISGDSHMLAIDDGTNSDYADGGGMPIPVFQAAALDQGGSVKGGPYSKGTFPGPGQFGLMTVTDDGKSIHVAWSGRNLEDKEIVAHSFTVT